MFSDSPSRGPEYCLVRRPHLIIFSLDLICWKIFKKEEERKKEERRKQDEHFQTAKNSSLMASHVECLTPTSMYSTSHHHYMSQCLTHTYFTYLLDTGTKSDKPICEEHQQASMVEHHSFLVCLVCNYTQDSINFCIHSSPTRSYQQLNVLKYAYKLQYFNSYFLP